MYVHLFVNLLVKQMLEKRKEYVSQLLVELKNLQERVQSVKNEEALPFSFFREAFDKTQIISRTLHELELLQIDDMKHQMEKLVVFLSETTNQPSAPVVEWVEEDSSEEMPEIVSSEVPEEIIDEEIPQTPEPEKSRINLYAEGIELPEYKNPRMAEQKEVFLSEPPVTEVREKEEAPVVRSINDTIQAPPAVLDVKRGLSLNDRFLFQRELFNNNRDEMNSMMLKINAFGTYPEVENYLREHTSWNFENQTVKDFLLALKKGME